MTILELRAQEGGDDSKSLVSDLFTLIAKRCTFHGL